jgi:hypothetical protein
MSELETTLLELPVQLSARPDSHQPMQAMREVAASAYRADFSADSPLSGRVMMPLSAEESNGVEDARFVLFTHPDGRTEYRATYTAYDGHRIAPRLITSDDLVSFRIHRLAGSGALNKGMALFPRLVGGTHLALSRTDGETISLAARRTADLGRERHRVSTHRDVGGHPARQLRFADRDRRRLARADARGRTAAHLLPRCLLLDLDDPTHVIARTREPLLKPRATCATDTFLGSSTRAAASCTTARSGCRWASVTRASGCTPSAWTNCWGR